MYTQIQIDVVFHVSKCLQNLHNICSKNSTKLVTMVGLAFHSTLFKNWTRLFGQKRVDPNPNQRED